MEQGEGRGNDENTSSHALQIAAGATYIVSDDSHFNVLSDITFPQLLVLKLKEFVDALQKEKEHVS